MTRPTSSTERQSFRLREPCGQFTNQRKLTGQCEAFAATTASLRRELRVRRLCGLAARIGATAVVLGLTAASIVGAAP